MLESTGRNDPVEPNDLYGYDEQFEISHYFDRDLIEDPYHYKLVSWLYSPSASPDNFLRETKHDNSGQLHSPLHLATGIVLSLLVLTLLSLIPLKTTREKVKFTLEIELQPFVDEELQPVCK